MSAVAQHHSQTLADTPCGWMMLMLDDGARRAQWG